MKAIVYKQYGGPEVLKLTEVEKPSPKDDEVLIKVMAASANPADWHLIRGKPLFARLSFGLFKPKNNIPGIDIAGIVEAIGKNISAFQPGDEVFGGSGFHGGGFAEYICATENNLVLKPDNITFEEAASIYVAAITALQGLNLKGEIQAGQKVLINGASGGVGTFAVQIAKYYGASVTGVCSAKNIEMVRSIGADNVIDYTKEDFTNKGQHYDLIFCTVGNRSVSEYKRALNENGNCIIAGFTKMGRMLQHAIWGPLSSKKNGKSVGLMPTAHMDLKDMNFLKELLKSGKLKPVIDREYPLAETAEAIRYLETGRARGKVIIKVLAN